MRDLSQAVIFDMNGVIVNDERFHQQSWIELFKRYNLSFTEEEFKQEVFGRTDYDTIHFAFGKELNNMRVNELCDERDQIVVSLIGKNLPVTPGVIDLLNKLHDNAIPLAIATSSRRGYAEFVINSLNIKKYFQTITTAEEIKHGKPDPEIYLLAASKIKIDRKFCTAIEDSISGIKAAQSAGMYCVAIPTTHSQEEISFADKVITGFEGITLRSLNLL